MNETEARSKWCPWGLKPINQVGVSSGVNRGMGDEPLTKCVGSDCIAWREGCELVGGNEVMVINEEG